MMMRHYNHQQMIRLINYDGELAETYLNMKQKSYEARTTLLYWSHVVGNTKRESMYDSLLDEKQRVQLVPLGPDTPIVAEIRALVNKHGWRDFIIAFAQFCNKKSMQLLMVGFKEEAYKWEQATEKVRKISKTLQL